MQTTTIRSADDQPLKSTPVLLSTDGRSLLSPRLSQRLHRARARGVACRGGRDTLHELIVALVEVVPEVELTVLRVRREVHDVHRDLPRQVYTMIVWALLHLMVHAV